eukprot:10251023-Heterocapsa_arctica.AAC.1
MERRRRSCCSRSEASGQDAEARAGGEPRDGHPGGASHPGVAAASCGGHHCEVSFGRRRHERRAEA